MVDHLKTRSARSTGAQCPCRYRVQDRKRQRRAGSSKLLSALLIEFGAALYGMRFADDLGVAVVSIKVLAGAPTQRTVGVGEGDASDGDPEIWCGEC